MERKLPALERVVLTGTLVLSLPLTIRGEVRSGKGDSSSVSSAEREKTTCPVSQDLQSDPMNCGSVGKACQIGDACSSGVCFNPENLQSDPNNCGRIGVACPTGDTCSQGACH